jgi:hypothetical protein
LEIPAKKLLVYKFIQDECSSQEAEQVHRLINEEVADEVLGEILEEAWQELALYPSLEADISEEIFRNVCHTTGINNAASLLAVKKQTGTTSKWLFIAATMTLLLVILVVPRK